MTGPLPFLPLAFAVCCCGAALSYTDARDRLWTRYAMAFLGALLGYLWAVAVARIPDRTAVYTFSLWWDAAVMVAYYLMPILAMGVRPSAGVCVGAALVVAGFAVIKAWG